VLTHHLHEPIRRAKQLASRLAPEELGVALADIYGVGLNEIQPVLAAVTAG
jgi:hypothetical protein